MSFRAPQPPDASSCSTDALSDAQPHPPSIEAVLDAFIRPDIETLQELHKRGPTVAHFLGADVHGPHTVDPADGPRAVRRSANPVFFPVLAAALHHLTIEEIVWRMYRVAAVLIHLFATWPDDGLTDAQADATLAGLISFLSPALQAPAPKDATEEVASETP